MRAMLGPLIAWGLLLVPVILIIGRTIWFGGAGHDRCHDDGEPQ